MEETAVNFEIIRRKEKAKAILENELVVSFFEKYKKDAFDWWLTTKTAEEREEIYRYMKTLEKFEGYFKNFIDKGKMEDVILKQKEKKVFGLFNLTKSKGS